MKKLWSIGALVIGISAIMVVTFLLLNYKTLYTNGLAVLFVDVSDNQINLQLSPSSSGVFCWGYKTVYRDETLFIKVKANNIPLSGNKDRFNLSIPNKFGRIKEIYLQDDTTTGNVLIWPKK